MKKFTFIFWPNGNVAEITVIAETKKDAEKLIRTMISDVYFDDGLLFSNEKDYN